MALDTNARRLLDEIAEEDLTPRVMFGMVSMTLTSDRDLYVDPGECVDTDACRVFCDALVAEDDEIPDGANLATAMAAEYPPGVMEEAFVDLLLSATNALPRSFRTALTDRLSEGTL